MPEVELRVAEIDIEVICDAVISNMFIRHLPKLSGTLTDVMNFCPCRALIAAIPSYLARSLNAI